MEAKALVEFKARVEQLNLLVRHVLGHKRGQQRQWVNRICDADARRHMLAEPNWSNGKAAQIGHAGRIIQLISFGFG